MSLEEQPRVVAILRHAEELLAQGVGGAVVATGGIDVPESPQDREQSRVVLQPSAQLARLRVQSQDFRLPRACDCHQRGTEAEPDLQSPGERVSSLGQIGQELQRLLKERHGLAIGRARNGLCGSLTKIQKGLRG